LDYIWAIRVYFEKRFFEKSGVSMEDCGARAAPLSERNRAFEVIDNPILQVNHP
jgi:hypothetical protein